MTTLPAATVTIRAGLNRDLYLVDPPAPANRAGNGAAQRHVTPAVAEPTPHDRGSQNQFAAAAADGAFIATFHKTRALAVGAIVFLAVQQFGRPALPRRLSRYARRPCCLPEEARGALGTGRCVT